MILNTLAAAKPTTEEVLAILRDRHRQACGYDPEADPDIDLTFESTVDDWRWSCDLLPWRPLAQALNEYWNVEIPLSEWKKVLTPPKQRRLKDVCDLLSQHITVPKAISPTLLGQECVPAGVFFAVRELLCRAGIDVSDLRPSTPLGEILRKHPKVFLGPISELAPGRLPVIKFDHPLNDRVCNALMVCLLGTMIGGLAHSWLPFVFLPFLLAVIFLTSLQWYVARRTLPESVTLGDLHTFRDLCVTLARGIHDERNRA